MKLIFHTLLLITILLLSVVLELLVIHSMAELITPDGPSIFGGSWSFLDWVSLPRDPSMAVWSLLILVVASGLFKLLLNGLVAYLSFDLSVSIARSELWRYVSCRYENIAHYTRPYVINNLINRTNILTNSALYAVINIFLSVTSIICVLFFMITSGNMALPYSEILRATLFAAVILYIIYRLLRKISEKISKGTEFSVGALLAILENIQVLHVYRLHAALSEPFIKKYSALRSAQAYLLVLSSAPRIVLELLLYTSIIWSISGATSLSLNQPQRFDFVLMIVLLRLLPYFASLFSSFMTLAGAQRDIFDFVRFSRDLRRAKLISSDQTMKISPGTIGSAVVEFSGVGYVYHDGTRALSNLSFEIHKGEILGIRGPSGTGKSTVINLICGLLDPSEGTVSYAAVLLSDSEDIPTAINVALVQQSVLLIPNTLRWNVALRDDLNENDDKRVLELLTDLGFGEEFASGLTLDTYVGDGHRQLSGGQVQRLGLARALFARKKLIVLDEFTSALDADAEEACLATIQQMKGDATVVIVSHREMPYKICDRTIVLPQGVNHDTPSSFGY